MQALVEIEKGRRRSTKSIPSYIALQQVMTPNQIEDCKVKKTFLILMLFFCKKLNYYGESMVVDLNARLVAVKYRFLLNQIIRGQDRGTKDYHHCLQSERKR